MTAVHIVCPHCGGINRVPTERLNDQPACGKCHKPVLDGLPVNLGGQTACSRRLLGSMVWSLQNDGTSLFSTGFSHVYTDALR
jgi:hypothetical protein